MLRTSKLLVIATVAATVGSCATGQSSPETGIHSGATTQGVIDVLHKQFPAVPLSVLTTITEIEGFNDSQELPGDGTIDNGPLAKLYIAPVRWGDTDFLDQWKLTAVLEIDGTLTMPNSYKNLGIKDNQVRTQYCVYLQHRTAGNRWIGAIAPVENANCSNPDDAKQLNVGEEMEPNTTKSDFPSVVRFDQDKNGKAIIGVTCGDKTWCEIGRNAGNGEKRQPVHDGLSQKTKKHLIKAWHDEQEVSVPIPSTGKFTRAVRASITPDENLGSYTMLDFTSAVGAVVATIYLETAPPPGNNKYRNWGLSDGNNTMILYAKERVGFPGEFDWTAEFEDRNGVSNGKRFTVASKVHSMNPPAVARWKWNPLDEDIWIACDQGCCTVSGQS